MIIFTIFYILFGAHSAGEYVDYYLDEHEGEQFSRFSAFTHVVFFVLITPILELVLSASALYVIFRNNHEQK